MVLQRAWLVCGVLTLASGCQPTLPGDTIGTYQLTMTLVENTCGATAVYIQDHKRFAAQLRVKDAVAYWRVPDQPMLLGSVKGNKFSFAMTGVVATSEPDAGPVCQIVQNAVLSGTVTGWTGSNASDAGSADAGVADAQPPDAGGADAGSGATTTTITGD